MNQFLLDTHVLVWAVAAPERLGTDARAALERNDYAVSVASLWELVNKMLRKTAVVRDPAGWWERYVTRTRIPVLPIRAPHLVRLQSLPLLHRDPFDRILVAQSLEERMTFITADETILDRYSGEMKKLDAR
jgi:PIN domain nuclease of toxin-antitoxin system